MMPDPLTSQPWPTHHLVRYGAAGLLGRFQAADAVAGNLILDRARGERVLIRSERGLEIGEVLRSLAADAGATLATVPGGLVIRRATPADVARWLEVAAAGQAALADADALAAEMGLPLSVVDAEGLLEPHAFILHVLRLADVDLRPWVAALSDRLAAEVRVHDLTAPAQAPAADGCGTCASGCGSCGTGGCGTGCADQPPQEFDAQWQEYFAELRERMDRRIALPAAC